MKQPTVIAVLLTLLAIVPFFHPVAEIHTSR